MAFHQPERDRVRLAVRGAPRWETVATTTPGGRVWLFRGPSQALAWYDEGMDRRNFLHSSLAVGSSAWLSSRHRVLANEAERPLAADALVAGKHADLRIVESSPMVLESPLALLAKHRITPKEILFVRNNVDMPATNRLTATHAPDWRVDIHEWRESADAPPTAPHSITVRELQSLPQTEVEMVVQCSGNSRSLMSQRAPIAGTPWNRGAVGNVVFRGVPLAMLFDKLDVRVAPQARYLTADGNESPTVKSPSVGRGKPGSREPQDRDPKDFEHSVPLDDALRQALLVLDMNGEPLPAIHGGPVRLVVPGYYGTVHIKWLGSLTLTAGESRQASQVPRYRNPLRPVEPGQDYAFTLTNSRPNWRMNVKSIVFAPDIHARVAAGAVLVHGVAFNDGDFPMESILLSWDRGASWQRAELVPSAGRFAWTWWTSRRVLPAGRHEVWARATDAGGRTQPLDGHVFWNPGGYEWNGVEKIPFECV